MLIAYPGDAEVDHLLAAQTSDWTIFWAREQTSGAVLLRQEPFVAIVHPSWPDDSLTLAELRALAEGKRRDYTMVTPDGGQAARELLSVQETDPRQIRAADWQAVQEYVATHEDSWGLVPWDAVTFRVRLLAVEGRWPTLENLQDYPLRRSLWLIGDIPIPDGLERDLVAALKYEPLPTVELVAVGDIMLDKTARQMMKTNGPNYPFAGEGVQPILSGADITFGNLENPISTRGKQQAKSYTFHADPTVVEGLEWAGFDVLSLANNHVGDYGDIALTDTLDILDAAHIVAVGAGRTITEAHEARIVESQGLKIAFLAYNQINPKFFAATDTSPGTAWMEPERMAAAVAAAQREADIVVVSCHWGVEYRASSDATQQNVARVLADAGADLIIGHHPHVVQGLQYHRSTFTAYSLGNFIFYAGVTSETTETVILRCLLDISGVKAVQLIPIAIKNAQPRVLSAQDGSRVIERIRRMAREQSGFPREAKEGD
jgi:poly-gamma-glutamate capsule biosynthesis protein CapA/YwtB (metallophosphatase superfamily)